MDPSEHSTRLRSTITAAGISTSAAEWAIKALHPPSDGTAVAIPDHTFMPAARLDLRPSVVIENPPGNPGNTWDLCILTLPGLENAAYYCAAPAGADFASTVPPVVNSVGVLTAMTLTAGTCAFNAAAGGVVSAPAPALNDGGVMAFRTTYRSITCELTASSLYNQGTVTAAQFDHLLIPETTATIMAPGVGDGSIGVTCRSMIPMVETQMTIIEPKSVVWPARDGVYMPHRLLGPVQQFAHRRPCFSAIAGPGTQLGFLTGVPTETLTSRPTITSDPAGFECGWLALITRSNVGVLGYNGPYLGETAFDNCATGLSIWRGLDIRASVTIRCFIGVEALLMSQSSLASFVRSPTTLDERALSLYYRLAEEMKAVYPARYNAFGFLLPLLAKAASAILPGVASAASGYLARLSAPAAPAARPPPPAPKPKAAPKRKKVKGRKGK